MSHYDDRQLPTVSAAAPSCRCGPRSHGCPMHHRPCSTCGRPAFGDTEGRTRHVNEGTHADARCLKEAACSTA